MEFPPRISHHGAVNGVTGSCHELHFSKQASILIDCGLFQGAEQSPSGGAKSTQLAIDFSIANVKALVVTHVHIDHVGRIPYLLAAGFKGPIYCSEASAVLLPLVLEDAVRIGFTRNQSLINKFTQQLKSQLKPLPFKRWQPIENSDKTSDDQLAIKLQPAGHILGSAYIECRLRGSNKSSHKVIFSGDLGAPYAPLLPAPKSPYSANTLVLESTYGNRQHPNRRLRQQQFKKILEKTLSNRGVVLIPAFSIGRTQELLYELEELIYRYGNKALSKDLPWQDLEIILDSPLAARFTEAYRQLKDCWDKEAQNKRRRGRHPLSFEQLTTIDSHQDHLATVKYLQKNARPCVVIAASGMCEGGRITNYLKAMLGDERHDVLFVGYQARNTAGRTIQHYGPRGGYVELDGSRYTIRAGIHTLSGYSAHADQFNLLNFIKRMRKRPQHIRLVHGDDDAKQELGNKINKQFPHIKVEIPND